jgi:hypothetical protein
VRIVHGSKSTTFSHMDFCEFSGPVSVTQGYQIGYAYNSGYVVPGPGGDGIHVHMQVNTSTTNFISTSFSVSGYTPQNGGGSDCPTGCPSKRSDNISPGYDTSYNFYSAMHSGLVSAGGWTYWGATVALASTESPCLTSTPAVAGCTSNGYSGLVQTYRGASAASQRGIFQRSGSSTAIPMSRSLYKPYTLYWDGQGHQGMWYIGYPTTASQWLSGSWYRMWFQNGYAEVNVSTCNSVWYQWNSGQGQYVLIKQFSGYCD